MDVVAYLFGVLLVVGLFGFGFVIVLVVFACV